MTAIPNTVRFGELHKSGPMSVPFEAAAFEAPTADTLRSARTINRDLIILSAAEGDQAEADRDEVLALCRQAEDVRRAL